MYDNNIFTIYSHKFKGYLTHNRIVKLGITRIERKPKIYTEKKQNIHVRFGNLT